MEKQPRKGKQQSSDQCETVFIFYKLRYSFWSSCIKFLSIHGSADRLGWSIRQTIVWSLSCNVGYYALWSKLLEVKCLTRTVDRRKNKSDIKIRSRVNRITRAKIGFSSLNDLPWSENHNRFYAIHSAPHHIATPYRIYAQCHGNHLTAWRQPQTNTSKIKFNKCTQNSISNSIFHIYIYIYIYTTNLYLLLYLHIDIYL